MKPRLFPLAVGTFAVGTETFVTAGLVQPISRDLQVAESAAGQLITVFAIAYAVLSPVLAALTARLSRKRVMLIALALFMAGGVWTALAPGFGLVLTGVVVSAAGAAMYTPNASATATALAPPERRGRALALVIGGLTVATVLAAPIGVWIAGAVSWRGTFWFLAVLALVALVAVGSLVPDVRLAQPARLADRLAPILDGRIAAVLVTQLLFFAAGFALYTYLAVVMEPVTGGDPTRFAALIWAWGLAGIVGNALAGRLTDRYGPRRMVLTGITAATISVALIPLAVLSSPGALAWAVFFGVTGWLVVPGQQYRVVSLAPDNTPVVLGLLAATQFAGISVGGLIGGLGLGLIGSGGISWIAAGIGLTALIFTAITYRAARSPREPNSRDQGVSRDRGSEARNSLITKR